MGLITVIYARLLYFIRHQTAQLLQTGQGRRAHRDLIVTRRMVLTVNILSLPGLPNIILFVMVSINPALAGACYMYRIQWMSPGVTLCILSAALVHITPRLKSLVTRERTTRMNQVVPLRQMISAQRIYPSSMTANQSLH